MEKGGPSVHGACPEQRQKRTPRHRGSHVRREAETGNPKNGQQHQQLGEGRGMVPPEELQKEQGPAHTLVPDCWVSVV